MFSGKRVLVVGGARGIGRSIVEKFVSLGARLLICDTDTLPNAFNQYRREQVGGAAEAARFAAALRAAGAVAHAYAADACCETEVTALYDAIRRDHGGLDVLVNAHGITHVTPVETMTLAAFRAVVDGNLVGTFLTCRGAIPLLRDAGGGAIVNIASVSGRQGFGKVAHYCAAKFGVVGFTSALAQELAPDRIRVNAICPGIVRTAMWEYLLDEFSRPGETREGCWERICAMIPQREPQAPEEIAEVVASVAAATRITGQAISVDGGMHVAP
ncbi:MAG TPA: SDR family NAD(P)-dependent oxidoreductase [Candidatus Elarobacter sp.]|jgi:NAD(P)-dependent dehydrogenase (short-subunit alcohol dehydrogenase family)|nr:SDR family NAD(P)-dependent oxidoreductase [Candidatus Elarobacter sp.]